MTKPLKTLAVVVLLLLLSPFIAISGFGFYHGLDVPNGVAMFTRELLGYGPLESGAHRVKADELRILSKPVLWMGSWKVKTCRKPVALPHSARNRICYLPSMTAVIQLVLMR